MLETVFEFAIIYILVPTILLVMFVFSCWLTFEQQGKSLSRIAGWLAGIIVFVLYIIYTPDNFSASEISLEESLDLAIGLLLVSACAGLIGAMVVSEYADHIPEQMFSLLALLLNTCALVGLHVFFVVRTYNDKFLSIIFGLLLGILLYFILFQTSRENPNVNTKIKR